MNRRSFLLSAAAACSANAQTTDVPESVRKLRPMTEGVKPITVDERTARLEKARRLMRENQLDAVYIGPGSTMFYFTGTRWQSSDTAGVVIPAKGELTWIIPSAAGAQAQQQIHMGTDIRTWDAKTSMEARITQAVQGRLGLEEQTPFHVFDGIRKASPKIDLDSADPVTIGCRSIKSPAEIALMQHATDVTIAAYRTCLAELREGMTQVDLRRNIAAAYTALGYSGRSFGKLREVHGVSAWQHPTAAIARRRCGAD